METIKDNAFNIWNYVYEYVPYLLLALATLVIGLWIIKIITRTVTRAMVKRNVDPSASSFITSLVSITLKVLLVISAMSIVGIEMTSFIAILTAATLAIGMALQGTLQNFAGGFMILVFKPFRAGDYIEAQGYAGTVREIQIFNTVLKTPDNKTIIIPNGGLATGSLINYSTEEQRRVDFTFGIGYNDEIDNAKQVLMNIISGDERIFKEPEPFIAVSELADSSVNLAVRVWAKSSDYWDIYFDMLEKVKKEFDKEGISIPYPQTDMHVYNVKDLTK
jgi:small conductance mechanosensitive channel